MKEYKKDDITVVWKPEVCIHADYCAHQLPTVFRPKEKPWFQTDKETKKVIIAQVNKCPSGALSVKIDESQ